MSAKENILARIREALKTPTERPIIKPSFATEIYTRNTELPEVIFAETFTRNNGEFFFCENLKLFIANLKIFLKEKQIHNLFIQEKFIQEILKVNHISYQDDMQNLEDVEASITLCENLVARTGSILVSSKQLAGRSLTVFPPIHIVLAFTSQLVNDIQDALGMIKEKYIDDFPSMISFITGPSRTADIEKTLVLGAHGPKELILFLVDDISENS